MSYNQKKYVFIQPYLTNEGKIPEGSEIIMFRNTLYLNGGMVHPAYQQMLMKIVNTKELNEKYLKEVNIVHNKI